MVSWYMRFAAVLRSIYEFLSETLNYLFFVYNVNFLEVADIKQRKLQTLNWQMELGRSVMCESQNEEWLFFILLKDLIVFFKRETTKIKKKKKHTPTTKLYNVVYNSFSWSMWCSVYSLNKNWTELSICFKIILISHLVLLFS